jgi:hypothetical protein
MARKLIYGKCLRKCFQEIMLLHRERGFQFADKTLMKIKDFLEHLNV